MKKILTKILSIALVFVMVMCLVPPVEAAASSKKPYYPTARYLSYYPKSKSDNRTTTYFGNYKTNYKITNIKSSNKKVATLSKKYKDNFTVLTLTAKRAGKTTITFNVKIGKKTHKYKTVVNVTKYTPPLKSLKIGKTNFTARAKKVDWINLGGKKTIKGKLSFKLNKNWKVSSINFYNANSKWSSKKNGSSITLKRSCDLFINCRNTKTGKWETVRVSNYRYL